MKKWSFLLAVIWLASWVLSTLAHEAQLLESSPANGAILDDAPQQVSARFSEELVFEESWIRVLNSEGAPVDNGDGGVDLNNPDRDTLLATLPDSLPEGVYTVEWHVVLLDGDATKGAFTFTIGHPTAVPSTEHPPRSVSSLTISWIASALGVVLIAALITTIVRKKVY